MDTETGFGTKLIESRCIWIWEKSQIGSIAPVFWSCILLCCGIGMFIDPNFFHPGSTSKNLSILTQKIISKLSEICSGLFIQNPDPDFFTHPGSRIQGSKRRRILDPDPHHLYFATNPYFLRYFSDPGQGWSRTWAVRQCSRLSWAGQDLPLVTAESPAWTSSFPVWCMQCCGSMTLYPDPDPRIHASDEWIRILLFFVINLQDANKKLI